LFNALVAVFKQAYAKRNFPLWFLIFVLPISMSFLMSQLFSYETPRHLSVGVVVEDMSQLSMRIIQGLRASSVVKFDTVCEDLPHCEAMLRQGKIYAVLYIPADMEKDALRSETPKLSLYVNAQSMLTGNLISKEIRSVVGAVGAKLEKKNIPEPISTELHTIGNPTSSYIFFLLIGIIAAIFHIVVMSCGVFVFSWPFREKTTSDWYYAANQSPVIAVLGRYVPLLFVYWLEFLIITVLVRHAVPMSNMEFYVIAAGEFLMIAACLGMSLSFVGVSGSMRLATSAAGVIGGPAFAFTGQTFPLLAMPVFVQWFAFCLPLTHFLRAQSAMFIGDVGISHAMDSLQILGGQVIFWLLLGIVTMTHQIKKYVRAEEDA